MLNFGDADTTQKATGATSAQIDFVCVLCTSSSTAAAIASLYLPPSACVSSFKGTSYNNIAISLPALFFFTATTKCLYKRHLSRLSHQVLFKEKSCSTTTIEKPISLR